MEKTHDYKDTIKEAAELDDDGKAAEERERKINSDIAYEALAVSGAMGMMGMDAENANLLQLELAQELLYLEDEQSHNADDDLG